MILILNIYDLDHQLTKYSSTMLDSAFDNCNGISSFGECTAVRQMKPHFLNSKRPIIKHLRNYHFNHSLYKWYIKKYSYEENIRHLLSDKIVNEWFDWIFSLNDTVGMKLLYESFDGMNKHGVDLQFIVRNRNIKIIYLNRSIEGRIKSIRNKWGWNHLSDDDLIKQHNERAEKLEKWFPERLNITFEELTNDMDSDLLQEEPTRKIFDYLELPYQELRPMTERTVYEVKERND